MDQVKAYAAAHAAAALAPLTIERRDPTATDVRIEILFCGVCHSDLHQVRDEWHATMPTVYPCVPGHEIVGRVTAVGARVARFKPGDLVGVGCLVDSDGTCPHCHAGLEQLCANAVLTYNSPDRHRGGVTLGGYAESIVVDERFVVRIPASLDPAAAAPLLCAGITSYSPLRRARIGRGSKVGILGLGGLGHMGVKIAHALGADVHVLTRSAAKRADALRLGADAVIVTGDEAELNRHAGTFEFILDTVSAPHDIALYLNLLRADGAITLVGAPSEPFTLPAFSLLMGRRSLSGSIIGGLAETQEMLDFCAAHAIAADVEVIPIQNINIAFERLRKADVKYRFVIDMASLRAAAD